MVSIEGRYVRTNNEGFEEYLRAIGGAEYAEAAMANDAAKPNFELSRKGDRWMITVTMNGKVTATHIFAEGVPYDDEMPHGAFLPSKTVTTFDGDTMTYETVLPDGNKCIRVYNFYDDGITANFWDEKFGVKAVCYYKRC